MPPKIGSRGRLPSGLPPQGKEYFNCVVANCDESIRGDRIVGHFQTNVKLDVLDEAKKLDGPGDLTNGLRYINVMCVDDTKQKNHTAFCLSNGYTSMKLPKLGCKEFKKKMIHHCLQHLQGFRSNLLKEKMNKIRQIQKYLALLKISQKLSRQRQMNPKI